MTNNPAAPARDGNSIANLSLHNGKPRRMGVVNDDPEKDLRIFYNLEMRQYEDDPGLWLDKARSMADPWLTTHGIVFAPDRGKIIMGVQGLNHAHTQDGFLEFMRDIKREYDATKELAAKVNGKPSSPFGPKPLSPEVQKKLEEDKVKTMEQIAEREREKQAQAALQNQLASAADDPTPTPSPDEPEKLADHFPRTVTGEPMPDKALINGKHWQKDSATRSRFFADYTGLCNKHQVPVADHTREKIRAAAQGTEHLEQYPGTPDELFAACKVRVEAEYPLKPLNDEIAPKKAAVKSVGSVEPPIEDKPLAGNISPVTSPIVAAPDNPPQPTDDKKPEFVPSPFLSEVKTLMGIPVGQIGAVLNRKYHARAYKEIRAKNADDKWTDLDPIAVRKRFDKVFGPQGYGWRIKPIEGVGRVEYSSKTTTTNAGKERMMHVVSFVAFVFEYALVVNGKVEYVQTSAFSDSADNDDQGYAYRSAFTSLMKQALKMFGGFDHFADKTAS